jgi:hypothetical protein
MRTYGRTNNLDGTKTWRQIGTDAAGHNDSIYATSLVQVLRLNLGESPFWGDWGIPGKMSVIQQIAPDYYTALTQKRFSGYFANLTVARVDGVDAKGAPVPTYRINILTNSGAVVNAYAPYRQFAG